MVETISVIRFNYSNKIVFVEDKIVDISTYSNALNKIKTIKKTGTLSPGDRVLFSKSSRVPRYKFAEYAKQNNVSRVVARSKATSIVVDVDNIVKRGGYAGTKRSYIKVPKACFVGYSNHSTPAFLYIDAHQLDKFKNLIQGFPALPVENKLILSVKSYHHDAQEVIDLAQMMDTVKVIDDDYILGEINKGIEVTMEVYEQLRNMLNTADKENISLAMEIMANCDYQKSELKICLLLNEFWSTRMYGNPYRNLVNFKSMLMYFQKYRWSQGDIEFADSIVKNTTDDMPDKEERIELARKRVLNWLNDRLPSDSSFSITTINIG